MTDYEKLVAIATKYGDLYPRYSGRMMYGDTCVGITTYAPLKVMQAAELAGIKGAVRDDMGLATIVYWPGIWAPETQPEQHLRRSRAMQRATNAALDELLKQHGFGQPKQ